jgi:hypothetical protein
VATLATSGGGSCPPAAESLRQLAPTIADTGVMPSMPKRRAPPLCLPVGDGMPSSNTTSEFGSAVSGLVLPSETAEAVDRAGGGV